MHFHIREEDLAIVVGILRAHLHGGAQVFVFGSRANGKPRRASDLDLAFDLGGPMAHILMSDLREAFEESDLPYKVDVVDLHAISESFKAQISSELKPLDMTSSRTLPLIDAIGKYAP